MFLCGCVCFCVDVCEFASVYVCVRVCEFVYVYERCASKIARLWVLGVCVCVCVRVCVYVRVCVFVRVYV